MRRPLTLLPALVVVAATVTGPVPTALGARTEVPAAPAAAPEDPLLVSIDSLAPSEIERRAPVRMTGTVTNVSDERWSAVNVHAFVGREPMTTSEELLAARDLPPDADLGDRIFTPGTFDDLGTLEPGESAPYEIRLERSQVPADEPGVYWFGAHALGTTDQARDSVADGRARTFLPLVSPRVEPVDTSVVIPLRRAIQHGRDGRVLDEEGWARDLASGGALRELVDLGAAARGLPVTWLVDPALPDTVQHLVEGNRGRSLASTVGAEPDGTPSGEATPSESDSGSPSAEPTEPAPEAGAGAEPGAQWLGRLDEAVARGGQVLALPYGDVDVSAARDHAPELLDSARRRPGDQLDRLDVPLLPAVAPPAGYLSTESLAEVPEDTVTLLSNRMVVGGQGSGTRDVAGREVVFTSTDVAAGGPGPDDPYGTVAMRQRLLAEVAVRHLGERRTPVVVVFPRTWIPERPRAFFTGLEVPWLSLSDAASLTPGRTLRADRLVYPPAQRAAELPAANFVAGLALARAGRLLGTVLTDNDAIDDDVEAEVLTALSYGTRDTAERSRRRSERALAWVERRTRSVGVRAPRGVTLSSSTGGFGATVSNRLDHSVTVSLKVISDASLSIDTPATLELAPRSSQTIEVDARTTQPGVHYVRLIVTDDTGTPLGSSDTLPVRYAQVSEVIWLILGLGVGLLFLAIAVRLVRRVRSERA